MKKYKYLIPALAIVGLMSSCAEDLTKDFVVDKPLSLQVMEELNSLDPLKSYKTASNISPDFKLSGALTAADFINGGNLAALAAANFDEIVAGNAMKYASCVDEKGNMSFSAVDDFVKAAQNANLSIYGHTLAWHSQQQPKYIEKLFENRGLEIKEEKQKEKEQNGNLEVTSNYCLKVSCGEAGANSWDKQAHYTLTQAMEIGKKYIVKAKIKASQDGVCGLWPIWTKSENLNQYGGSKDLYYYADQTITKDWQEISWTVDGTDDNSHAGVEWEIDRLQFVFGKLGGEIYFDDVTCTEVGGEENFINNSDFDKESVEGWSYSGVTGARYEDKVYSTPANHCIEYVCGEAGANPWDKQAHYTLTKAMEIGKKYVVTAKIKATEAGDCALWPIWTKSDNLDECGGSKDLYYLDTKSITKDWQEVSWTVDGTDNNSHAGVEWEIDKLQFVFGKLGGSIYFDDVTCTEVGSEDNLVDNGDFEQPSTSGWGNNWNGPTFKRIEEVVEESETEKLELVENGDCEKSENKNFVIRIKGAGGDVNASFSDGGKEGKCIIIDVAAKVADPWDNQFFVSVPDKKNLLDGETTYTLEMDVKAAVAQKISVQTHAAPGDFIGGFGDINATTEWKHFKLTGTLPVHAEKGQAYSLAFNLNDGDGVANTFYFDNISLSFEKKLAAGDISDEEKNIIVTKAMRKWIEGMMEATNGYVKAWDVVNEPIAGEGDDGEGNYPLQHGTANDDGIGGNTNVFFWQDYMGDLDYVRTTVAAAREFYKGEASDLKLFINDYNLESDWDDNKKLKSLIAWVKKWEADGVTKIDGLGTQMHISCYEDESLNNKKKEHIVKMFELMAATGKLVRVSELDMGYVAKDGTSLQTEELTDAQHQQMADLYKFVIKTYLEKVPAAQQYGICQWCLTDSPKNSSWRGGQPTGLWTEKFVRKATFKGFAEGLSGK